MMSSVSPYGRLACCAVCAGLFLLAAAPCAMASKVDLSDPPQGVFIDEWMVVEMMGGKVGYSHAEIARTGNEINTSLLMSMSLARVGAPVTITQLQSTRETLDGVPLEFTTQMDASMQQLRKQGVIREGKVKITSKQFGAVTVNEYDFPKGALMTWGTLRKQEEMGYKPGTKYSLDIYEASLSATAGLRMDIEIQDKETIEIGGRSVEAIRTVQNMSVPNTPMEMSTIAWVDEQGDVLRTSLNMMGMAMTITRATKEQALADFSPPEFFTPTTIKVRSPIDRRAARQVDYLLRLRDRNVQMPLLPPTGMQKPTVVPDDAVRLTVSRQDHERLRKTPSRTHGKQYREYLTPNPIINSDDPAVQKMAQEARGQAKLPYETADNLRKHVTDVIKDKNLNVGFASASEVCRNREGDCSEHAVLLAALGRACDLPSRVVTGMVYVPVFGGDTDIFGFHMWTQFLIGDTWVDFDAAQGESDCNPTHIAFSVASLHDGGLGQVVFGLVNVIGNLELTVERIDPAPAKDP